MNGDNHDAGAILPPEQLLELLEAARAADPSDERYREAGALAWKITRLRQERQRLKFDSEPLETCLSRLADTLSIDLQPVLDWFGISRLDHSQPIEALCRLGTELGIAAVELFVHLGRSIAKEQQMPVPAAPWGDRIDDQTYAAHCAEVLERLPWDLDTKAKLGRIKKIIDHEYGKRDS